MARYRTYFAAATGLLFTFLTTFAAAQTTNFTPGVYLTKLGEQTWALRFTPQGKFTVFGLGEAVVEGSYFVNQSEITLKDESGKFAGKGAEQVGKYRWQLQNRQLRFGKIEDKQEGRFKVLTFSPWTFDK